MGKKWRRLRERRLDFFEHPSTAKPRRRGAPWYVHLAMFGISSLVPIALFRNVLFVMDARLGVVGWLGMSGLVLFLTFIVWSVLFVLTDKLVQFLYGKRLPWMIRDWIASSTVLRVGTRKPTDFCLLLRPFEFDFRQEILPTPIREETFTDGHVPAEAEIATWNGSTFDTQEPVEIFDALYGALRRHMHMIAVGRRGPGQEGGPGLYPTEDAKWKDKLGELIEKASLIFARPWSSGGIQWELESILSSNVVAKTVFIMPPSYFAITSSREWRQPWDNELADQKYYFKRDQPFSVHIDKSRIRHAYVSALPLFQKSGYELPGYRSDGGLFVYLDSRPRLFPIPYDGPQMSVFLRWRAQLTACQQPPASSSPRGSS